MSTLKDERLKQLKQIEINTYYSKQYDAHWRIMQLIAVMGICILVAIGIGYIPLVSIVSKPLIMGIIFIGSALIVLRMMNMYFRRSDNYDEFVWISEPSESASTSSVVQFSTTATTPFICASSQCCSDGTIWSDGYGCITNPTSTTAEPVATE